MAHPQRKTHTPNGFGHFDIAGPELAPLKLFYTALFGWDVTERGPGYAMVATPEGSPNGAIVETPAASLTLGVVVPDLDAALAAAARSSCPRPTMAGSRRPRSLIPPAMCSR